MFGFENCKNWFISPTRKIGWSGQYTKENNVMHFNITDMTWDIHGNISGFGGDSAGSYNIVGKLLKDNQFEFYKNYHSQKKTQFQGKFENTGVIKGSWLSNENDGTENGPMELKLPNCETWVGNCFYGKSSKYDIGFSLNLDSNEVFGFGRDTGGYYYMVGSSERKNEGKFKFVKRYAGDGRIVAFLGTMSINGSNQIISGDFKDLEKDISGKFQLKLTDMILPNEVVNNRPISKYSGGVSNRLQSGRPVSNYRPTSNYQQSPRSMKFTTNQNITAIHENDQSAITDSLGKNHLMDAYNQDMEFEISQNEFSNIMLNNSVIQGEPDKIKIVYEDFTEYELQYASNTDLKRVNYAITEIEKTNKKFNKGV